MEQNVTDDWSYKDIMGLGTLSGASINIKLIKKGLIKRGIEPTKENILKVWNKLSEEGVNLL